MVKTKKFSKEFKIEATKLSAEIGLVKAAEQLGVGVSTLSRWKSEFKTGDLNANAEKKTYQELETEIRQLKKENGYIKQINDILKKSTAIFSNEQIGDLKL